MAGPARGELRLIPACFQAGLGRCQTHSVIDEHPCRHFSLSNPEGPSGPDLPLLLRRLADTIESQGIRPEDLLDVTLGSDEVNEHGTWWRATVYWEPSEPS